MSDQTMFSNQTNTPATQDNNVATAATSVQNNNPYADLLGTIRNEQGVPKYNSVEEALKGAANAQTFIQQLLQEKRDLESQVQAKQTDANKQAELERTVQELLNKVNDSSNQKASVAPEDIAELVNRTLTQRDTEKSAKENQAAVVATATKAFGTQEEAGKKFIQAAQEAGLSVQELEALAARSPKAVLKMMGVNEQPINKQGTTAPMSTHVNTAGFSPAQDSFVKRNDVSVSVGASSSELNEERIRSNRMVEELHTQGMSVYDLTDPKVYKKYFGH